MLSLEELAYYITYKKAYIEEQFHIQNKERQDVLFKYNTAQNILASQKTSRTITLKSRQQGISTFWLAQALAEAITVPNTVCVFISYEDLITQRLFYRVKYMFDHLPDPKPKAEHYSAYEITFPAHGSSLYIGTARASIFGKGDTISMAIISELPSWPDERSRSIFHDLSQAVPKNGQIHIEATPEGRSGLFYELFQDGKQGGIYKPFFFPWWLTEEYTLPRGSPLALEYSRYNMVYTIYENSLIEKFQLTEDQIRWRRLKLEEAKPLALSNTPEELFQHQYPEYEETCWLITGGAVFNQEALRLQLTQCKPVIRQDNLIKYWKLPRGSSNYIIGVDTASGSEKGDYSAAVVIDSINCEQVASIHVRIPVDIFARRVYELHKQYNNALIVPEIPGHGQSVIDFLIQMGCSNIYTVNKKPGFVSSVSTRKPMIDKTSSYLNSNALIINDPELIEEAIAFKWVNDRPEAPYGKHDDYLFALMLAIAVRDSPLVNTQSYPAENYLTGVFSSV